MNTAERLRKLNPGGSATFTFEVVIAGRSPDTGARTHQGLQKVCSTIIDAFRVSNDATKSSNEKKQALLSVSHLEGDLEWLATWTRDETDYCVSFAPQPQMSRLADTIATQVSSLRTDMRTLSTNTERFPNVFDVMLSFLESMTEFLKIRHAAEVQVVIEGGKNAYAECNNLYHIEVPSLLVPQGRLMKERTENFHSKCVNLVNIQEASNRVLKARAENVGHLLSSAIPDFIIQSKEYLLNMGDNNYKHRQTEAYNAVISCLDEINKILERVKGKFTNTFEQENPAAEAPLTDLEAAVNNLFNNLAKLRVPDEQVRAVAADNVPPATKTVLAALTDRNVPMPEKKQLIENVRDARDGSIPQYFTSLEAVGEIVQKAQTAPLFSIPLSVPTSSAAPGDMLEAAKAMCSALKGLSFSLDV